MNARDRNALAVVTGASTGIGRATALHLARTGFHVLAGVRRSADADDLRAAGSGIEPILLDVTDESQVAALAARVDDPGESRPLRALVNNAGIAIDAPVEVLPIAEWKRQFDVSVFGQVAVTQALLPALTRSRGRVVNVGSMLSTVALPGSGPYSAAKAAMDAVSDVLRREVAEFGVGVIVIVPGVVTSKLSERGLVTAGRIAKGLSAELATRYDRQLRAHVTQATAYAKTGVPAEVAAGVILKAIDARRPRTRYTVGRDAAMFTRLARFLPDRTLDSILSR